jgi:putrescine aminotransferase
VAQKVLEITTRPETQSSIAGLIERFDSTLTEIRARQPYLTEVRQTGLVIGLRVDHPNGAVFLQQELFALGLWAIASGFDQSVLQFKPGLLLDEPSADAALERLEEALIRVKDVDRPVPQRHRMASKTRT